MGPLVLNAQGERQYRHPVHGRTAPSVTQILVGQPRGAQSEAMRLGTDLHRTFEQLLGGNPGSADEEGFSRRVNEFLEVYEPDVLATEQTLWGRRSAVRVRWDCRSSLSHPRCRRHCGPEDRCR